MSVVCKKNREDLVVFLQNFIYLMNDTQIRDKIVQNCIKKNKLNSCKWLGTIVLSGLVNKLNVDSWNNKRIGKSLKSFLEKDLKWQKTKTYFFTVMYTYEQFKVHYLSYIYEPKFKKLTHFDPGISLYEHGQKTVVPSMNKAFCSLKLIDKKSQEIGVCNSFRWKGKKMGIQFNNLNDFFPADAFCQTWTVFFFIRYCHSSFDFEFLKSWCNLKPEKRELFLISNFILPFLNENPKYYKLLQIQINDERTNYINTLYEGVENCLIN